MIGILYVSLDKQVIGDIIETIESTDYYIVDLPCLIKISENQMNVTPIYVPSLEKEVKFLKSKLLDDNIRTPKKEVLEAYKRIVKAANKEKMKGKLSLVE